MCFLKRVRMVENCVRECKSLNSYRQKVTSQLIFKYELDSNVIREGPVSQNPLRLS
jgi:hypothetical protein